MNRTHDQNNTLGALWEKIGARGTYMTGKIDPSKWDDEALAAVIDALAARQPVPLVVFRRDTSKDPADSKRPTWDILKPRARDAAATPRDASATPRDAKPLTASDIPF